MNAARLRCALRAGLNTLLAFVLTSALFAAPVLAAEHDYGHTHPEGTPDHVHTLDAVLGAGAEGKGTDLTVTPAVQAVTLPPRALPQSVTPPSSHHSRAPPPV